MRARSFIDKDQKLIYPGHDQMSSVALVATSSIITWYCNSWWKRALLVDRATHGKGNNHVCCIFVRRAGLMGSHEDPEMYWSVPLTCAWLNSFILFDFCLFVTIFIFYFELCTYCNIVDIYLLSLWASLWGSRLNIFGILENYHCWRFHGSGIIAALQIIVLIFFCTGMHHGYFLRSSMCFRVPHLCSKIPKICNWSMDNGVHSVCFRGDFAIKTVVGFLR